MVLVKSGRPVPIFGQLVGFYCLILSFVLHKDSDNIS